jgi:predicted heme/steroid binding protein
MKVFDKEELAKYDGKEGRPAYVAYLGKVYDFSDTHEAEHGDHYGHPFGVDQEPGARSQEPGAGREGPYRGNHAFGVTGLLSECRGKTIMHVIVNARSTEMDEGDAAISGERNSCESGKN